MFGFGGSLLSGVGKAAESIVDVTSESIKEADKVAETTVGGVLGFDVKVTDDPPEMSKIEQEMHRRETEAISRRPDHREYYWWTGFDKKNEEEDEEKQKRQLLIPKHFALKSNYNNKYLRYVHDDEKVRGCLRFSGDRVVSPYTKFHVEHSRSNKELVHIRCVYNNKYWTRVSSQSNSIVAAANRAEEDPSKWSCTLFKPEYYSRNRHTVGFRHVQTNHFLYHSMSSDPYTNCLVITDSATNDDVVYEFLTIVDWDSIFILPRHLAFKGDNGEYLKPLDGGYRPYLQFSGADEKDPWIAHEIFPTSDGHIRIKNDRTNKFWVHDPNWILAESTNPNSKDPNTLFLPVKVDNTVVALLNKGNNLFCQRLTADSRVNCLNAAAQTITNETRMEIVELVVSRAIENIEYRLADARVYGQKVITMSKGEAVNRTKETDTITFKFSYEVKKKTNWTNSIGVARGISTKFKAGVPLLGGSGEIEISAEFENEFTWGESHKEKKVMEFTHAVAVPPMSRVKVSGLISQGHCAVPFSYTQRDTLRSGKKVVHRLHDGVFNGVNSYDFKFESKNIPL